MDIGAMNERVTFQKNAVTVDKIGNHINGWTDYFSCHTTVSGTSGGGRDGAQDVAAGYIADHTELSFTVRWCAKTAAVGVTGYRILFRGETYDIIAIDPMNYKRRCLKFRCKKETR